MENLYETVLQNPEYFRQFRYGDSLITRYDCPLKNRFADIWSEYNYIVYVSEGKKIWHTNQNAYELTKGNTIFVKKGACIVEQFFDTPFCLVVFFISDDFIRETLVALEPQLPDPQKLSSSERILRITTDKALEAFFYSMSTYFAQRSTPEPVLLGLKFKELVLTIFQNPHNRTVREYLLSLLHSPQNPSLEKVMLENFSYNLTLEEYAKLCNRSLSTFKRDFKKQFQTTPAKWLSEKRLSRANQMLQKTNKTISEIAFENGFENPSHFSRIFKAHYGIPPIKLKNPLR